MLFALGNGLDRPRWGLSVPKKVGSAVERNRVKRRLREIVRRETARIDPGTRDVCILARPGAAAAEPAALRDELIALSRKLSSSSSARTSA